jgi:hypothetical protein
MGTMGTYGLRDYGAKLVLVRVMTIALSCVVLALPSRAQTPPAFLGKWKVTWEGRTRSLEANLLLTETGGTWRTLYVTSTVDPCAGKEYPVEAKFDSDKEAVLTMIGARVLRGCSDFTVTMTLDDSNNGTGTRGSAKLMFVRQ